MLLLEYVTLTSRNTFQHCNPSIIQLVRTTHLPVCFWTSIASTGLEMTDSFVDDVEKASHSNASITSNRKKNIVTTDNVVSSWYG